MRSPLLASAALVAMVLAPPAEADDTGSQGCATLVQAAADGAAARMQANDAAIQKPQSVTQLSCLDGFFNGTGLNVVSNLLNPGNLLNSVKGQICQAVDSAWQNTLGSAQCGLTVSGFNIGFGGFNGAGLMCPKLSFGGGGPPIGSINSGYRVGNGNGLYVNGSPTMPDGYTAPANGGIF